MQQIKKTKSYEAPVSDVTGEAGPVGTGEAGPVGTGEAGPVGIAGAFSEYRNSLAEVLTLARTWLFSGCK